MRNIKPVVVLALALAAAPLALAAGAIEVIGRSLATVYVDGGRGQGLNVGDRVRVLKGQTTVAEMVIVAVNEHSAACRVVSQERPIGKGDTVVPVSRPRPSGRRRRLRPGPSRARSRSPRS